MEESNLQMLDKNLLIEMSLNLNVKDLASLCRTSKRMNEFICNNNLFWRKKLDRDYDNIAGEFAIDSNFKEIYESLQKSYIFTIEYFDKVDPNWRKKIVKLVIIISIIRDVLSFQIYPEYNIEFEYFPLSLTEIIRDKLVNIYNERYGKEKKRERFRKGFFGKDILELFHPLLLLEFKKYGIYLETSGKFITPNSVIKINFKKYIY